MSSQETKKSAAKFGKFGSKKPSAKFKVPKLIKPSDGENGAASVSVDAKPEPKTRTRPVTAETKGAETEKLPQEELLDESDLEELDDSELVEVDEDDDDGEDDEQPEPTEVAGVTSGTVEARPVDPFGATQAIGSADVAALRAHKAAVESRTVEVSGSLPGVSADPLASAAPERPDTTEDAAAAVAALDGLDDLHAPAPITGAPYPMTPPPQMMTPPSAAIPPGPSSGPFAAVQPAYPVYSTPTPLPQQAPFAPQHGAIPTPFPAQHTPVPQATPRPGSMEAARQASWKRAHPSARRWARRRDSHTGAGRRTPAPLRIGAGLILIGVGIYLLLIFIPAHRPDAPSESERTEAGKIWRFTETQHSVAAGLAFGFVALGLFGAARGATYRREVMTRCRTCRMEVEATREGLALRCHNGGHKAGLAISSVVMLGAFVIIGSATVILLLSASLG